MSATISDEASAWQGLRVLVVTPVPTWPVELGNRGRILAVTQALKDAGARITLLHYPSDEAWRRRFPHEDHAAMLRQWGTVHVAPVTRPLHSAAVGEDHTADEWWDPAIGQMLDWLFKVERFDALLVNYTWLSKALEHAPRGVLRILDTHDQFTGRRAVLAANGLAAEYFHLSEQEERKALARADVVWAIKPQEEEFFRTICDRRVRTLPHVERPHPLRVVPGEPGVFRWGFLGGRNNINRVNLEAFLKAAHAYLRRTLLPVEIVVAGSICDLLGQLRWPFLKLLGRVGHVDEFYAQVDGVLVPIAFSTGLKIKVGEALARGKPVISHAHAFEGYVPAHPFHECDDFEAMLRAIHHVAREPALLRALGEAALFSAQAASRLARETLEATGREARALPASVVFVLPFAALRPGALLFDHVVDAARYIGHQAPVAFFLFGPPEDADPALAAQLAEQGRVVVEAAQEAALGPLHAALFGEGCARFAGFAALAAEPHLALWLAGLPEAVPGAIGARLGLMHLAALGRIAAADAPERLAALAAAFPRFLLMEDGPSRIGSQLARIAGAERVQLPFLWRAEGSALIAALQAGRPGRVALLLPDVGGDAALVPVLAHLTTTLGLAVDLYLDDPGRALPGFPVEGPLAIAADAVRRRPLDAFFDPATHGRERPRFVVEFGRRLAAAAAREVTMRAGIPHLRLFDEALPRVASGPALRQRARGFVAAALAMAAMKREGEQLAELVRTGRTEELSRDAGWARLWHEVGRLARDAAA